MPWHSRHSTLAVQYVETPFRAPWFEVFDFVLIYRTFEGKPGVVVFRKRSVMPREAPRLTNVEPASKKRA